jgi:hypothetical protein
MARAPARLAKKVQGQAMPGSIPKQSAALIARDNATHAALMNPRPGDIYGNHNGFHLLVYAVRGDGELVCYQIADDEPLGFFQTTRRGLITRFSDGPLSYWVDLLRRE